ncbi:MAG: hypothetical protein KatS3mg108_2642 [Isosphaeraceae bacterium]|jgi:hypothetical protein|nr:MAG: hypothetical protein KatS3mg108_2642 [Isosphaeraceae bacterium]
MEITGRLREPLALPESLREQLRRFRGRVWWVKTLEGVCAAALGVLTAYLTLFGLDRLVETPGWVRLGLAVGAVLACLAVPLSLHRWVWRARRPEQLARLLAKSRPRLGDHLLGVIELAESETEQARSRRLCEAAIEQVAEEARKHDLSEAVPRPRHRVLAGWLVVPVVVVLGLWVVVPAAAANAWARLVAPWREVPRYTFTALRPVPDRLIVPHGEGFAVEVELERDSAWRPEEAHARLGRQAVVPARLAEGGRYRWELPGQLEAGLLVVRVGDAERRIRIEPQLRPELTEIMAEVALPAYLERPGVERRDLRGGSIGVVGGSSMRLLATAGRELAEAWVDDQPVEPEGATITTPAVVVEEDRAIAIRWRDRLGLEGKEPLAVRVTRLEDEAPMVAVEGLPRQRVVLDREQLVFRIQAQDDFGVRQVGMEWQGIDDPTISSPARGERLLAAGGPTAERLEVGGTFQATALGIEPQPVQMRVYVEDYRPEGGRVYSPAFTFYVLSAEQHAIWLTEMLNKWHRQSLEVRDRELLLLDQNKQLRQLDPEELDRPETRRRIENQAAAERANGRRLSALVVSGEDLIQQAMRNPEFGVGHLERWAEMLQILKDIAANRMPTVADLLKEAAEAPPAERRAAGPVAGMVRAAGEQAGTGPGANQRPAQRPTPAVVDIESNQNTRPTGDDASRRPPASAGGSPRLGLPVTTTLGSGQAPSAAQPPALPVGEKLDEAIRNQEALLAEFEKVAEELNQIMARLEGSTLVKRLKAESRRQYKVAGRIADYVGEAFGRTAARLSREVEKALGDLAAQEAEASQALSTIMDDLEGYYERRRLVRFRDVLEEMRNEDVVGALRQLGDDLMRETGLSIAQAEYWSDTLDRWAEELFDPACAGQCPGSKSRSSLPPSIVLEVLQILEAEVDLREATRVAEQARPAQNEVVYGFEARQLAGRQDAIRGRVAAVAQRIAELPDGEQEFAYELNLLGQVHEVMREATDILDRPETGREAIAAETEAIELLLRSRRINPRGGGGGGPNPGGGGTGTTQDSALALIGRGINEREVREDRGVAQAVGDAGPTLPEEFRAGLDEYFNRLDRPESP